jgi:ABC-type transporter Mla subunit MlaD
MNLQQQIEILVAQSPQDIATAVQAIAPVLLQEAEVLSQTEYFIVVSPDGRWQTTTLSHRQQPGLEKTIIYAFADAQAAQTDENLGLRATQFPVIQLLFQLLGMEQVDSLVFVDIAEQQERTAVEVTHEKLRQLVNHRLSQMKSRRDSVPPDIA